MRKFLLAALACFAFVTGTFAQYRCGTDLMNNRERARNPFLVQAQDNYERLIKEEMLELRNNRDGEVEAVLVIPMVFHILHMEGPENITDEQIYDQMEILNRDYNKLNGDTIEVIEGFDTIIANVKLEFRLATKDFMGNCTNGIERIKTIETFVGDNGSKISQWPRERYLNVWTVANMENGVAGYSQYPSSVIDDQSARADGVIIRHNYIGSINTSNEYNSRALTHEIGHYLDLSHPWGNTNDPEVECGDDSVADTPVTEGHDDCNSLYDYSCNATPMTLLKYKFDDVVAGTGGMIDPTSPPIGYSAEENFPRLTFSDFSAHGVSSNPTADSLFSFSGWGTGVVQGDTAYAQSTGSIDLTNYYEFTLTPRPGTAMTVQEIKFNIKRDETGPRSFALRSSQNNFGTNVSGSMAPVNPLVTVLESPDPINSFWIADTNSYVLGVKLTFSGTGQYTLVNLNNPLTFRIYAWNAEDEDGSFAIDSLNLVGTFGAVENVQNYMDYSYCSHMFTLGQKERMRTALSAAISGRNNLYTDLNRQLTGTDDNPLTCAPNADFYPAQRYLCIGDETTFLDNSTNGEVDSWSWTFEDGNPATSTAQFPEVSFNSAGRKTVTLTVTNEQGSTSKTIEQCVIVAGPWTEFPGTLIQEGFDSQDEFYNRWHKDNFDNNSSTWQQVSTTGFSNNTCVRLNAYDMDGSNIDEGGRDIDQLVSPSMDLGNITGSAEVTFKWAYASQSTNIEDIIDRLEVYISDDCGATWSNQPRLTLEGLDLVTAGNVASYFIPDTNDDWMEESFTVPSSYHTTGFRMMFIFFAGDYPNNLYIDDINMSAALNVDEQNSDFYGVQLFPNPADEVATLRYTTNSNASVNITLTDLSGRIVSSWTPNNAAPGNQTLQIPTSELAKGIYTVNLTSDKTTTTLKLMVN